MKLEVFANIAKLNDRTELEKAEYLAFYFSENKDQSEIEAKDLSAVLTALGFARPNSSRLLSKIRKSRSFVKGTQENSFRLAPKRRSEIKLEIPDITDIEEIISDDSILPEILFTNTKRPYLIKIAQQINSCYENNLFDACSLMMRRLLEILLIHCFEETGLGEQAKDQEGNYNNLKTLINKATSRKEIGLSPESKKEIDSYRELGNLSAHRIKYNCRKSDIKNVRIIYRALIEELLYIAKLTQHPL
ncbi:DUF4145 domain-containing protein [Stutzerimonas stutzeri]|uniref:DUF4145 domain-containing protein n=1 Tax=Stutzerimonas stutzeri TaxID=316 RepID=UPI00037B8D74|nr:DUF4145 domain-containing protein [Stutzerimonas stutzeri]